MAHEGARPQDESELESAWDLLDNASDVSDEVEEAEERTEPAEDADDESTAKDGDADENTASVAEEPTEDEGGAAEEQKVPKEKKKKKGKAARVVKGFKKFVGGVFRPSGSKLKWDVDANVSLKATYESNVAEERSGSEERVPTKPKSAPSPKQPAADPLPAKQKTGAVRPEKSPDESEQADGPSTSADAASLAAENEELRQRYRILLNMQENYNRNHEPICFCAFYSHLLSNLIYGWTE